MDSYFNGKYIESQKLSLPLLSDLTGTIRGYRIFTACKTVNGRVFCLNEHIKRLSSSAKQILMKLPYGSRELKEIVQKVVERNKRFKKDLLLEIICSGGPASSNGIVPEGKSAIYILVLPLKMPPSWWYEKGISLATYPYQRQWPEVKTLNYIGAVIAHKTNVKKFKAQEALFISPEDKETILEGTTFNFFIVKHKTLITPPLDGRILSGITRAVVIKLAKRTKVKVMESNFKLKDLKNADEAFLTSSTRNIVPVIRVDNIKIGSGSPGETTLKLSQLLNR